MIQKSIVCLICLLVTSVSSAADEKLTELQERGRYLTHDVAMCVYCHTSKDSAGNLRQNRWFDGSSVPVSSPYPSQIWAVQAPNLRSLPLRWGEKEFVQFLQTGKTPDGETPRLPMPPFRMTEEDAKAVAAYLNTLKSLQ